MTGHTSGARIISVGGGKGGVGKSIISMNLAATFASRGLKVVIADLDLGAANLHLLLGIPNPKPGVAALLRAEAGDVRQLITPTPIANLGLLAGTGAVLGAADISIAEKSRMLRRLRALEADIVIVDVGAGVGYNALDFFELGSQRLVVATPQVTSIHDAYSFLKGAVLRVLQRVATKTGEATALLPATHSNETEKVSAILARIKETNPEFAARLFSTLRSFGAYMVGNQVTDPAQAGVFHSVSKLMMDYLGISVPILGWLRANPKIHDSVNKRKPYVLDQPGDDARVFRAIADAMVVDDVPDDLLLLEDDEPAAPAPATRPAGATARAPQAAAAPATARAPRETTPPPKVLSLPYVPPTRKRQERKKAAEDAPKRRNLALPGLTPKGVR